MGRKSRGRNRKGSRKRGYATSSHFVSNQMEQMVEDNERYEKYKDVHNKHLKDLSDLEVNLLNRTIYVTNVANLNNHRNKLALRNFFEVAYGPVEHMELISRKLRRQTGFPSARITFMHEIHAQQTMGGNKLEDIRNGWSKGNENLSKKQIYNSSVAHAGFIEVNAARPQRLASNVDKKANIISFTTLQLSLGHWLTPQMIASDPLAHRNLSAPFGNDESSREGTFLEEHTISSKCDVQFDVKKRILLLTCKDSAALETNNIGLDGDIGLKIETKWKNIQGHVAMTFETSGGNRGHSLVFRLLYPPRVYKSFLSTRVEQRRVSSLLGIPLDRCLSFRLHLDSSTAEKLGKNTQIGKPLRKFGIFELGSDFMINPLLIATQRIENGEEGANNLQRDLANISDRKLAFLARAVVDNGVSCWYHFLYDKANGQKSFVDLVEEGQPDNIRQALEHMKEMHSPTVYPARVLYDWLLRTKDDDTRALDSLPDYCMEIPRMLITPTRLAVTGFDVEMSNRVIRHFIGDENFDPEDFLRITFGDEDSTVMFSAELSKDVCQRFENILLSGIPVNGRKYVFLAYSSSQLKERSVWMVSCPTSHLYRSQSSNQTRLWTVALIRDWMGNFSSIKSPSKYAARLGQCFSTTFQAASAMDHAGRRFPNELHLTHNDKLPDVTILGKHLDPWCHSDGTGLIRKDVMKRLLRDVSFSPRNTNDVSIIQIRFGGSKGTLTAWNFSDLQKATSNAALALALQRAPADVYLRPSMIKFDAIYRHLEVISIGARIPYHLNRQMVMLLDVHEVPKKSILQMQWNMLNELDALQESAADVHRLLPILSGPDSGCTSTLLQMASVGISPKHDPYLFGCINAIRSHHLMNLQKKARIRVEKGAVLMGGLDETGNLPENCVFLQVWPDNFTSHSSGATKSAYEIIAGPVLVAKHPVVHPGDVRMLVAVDVPELRDHRNVILFSQKGHRPEADKMAGSDLDGDQFAITWDSRLFLKEWNRPDGGAINCNIPMLVQRANAEPMEFEANEKPAVVDHVKDSDLVEHFIKHACSESLGMISMLWLDWASLKKRADCEECLQLAELHSIAVDFPKSGVAAIVPRELRIDTVERAHWREKKGFFTYHCDSIVGQLYDQVTERLQRQKMSPSRSFPSVAGRVWNKVGRILCSFTLGAKKILYETYEKIYDSRIVYSLGLMDEQCTDISADPGLLRCLKWAANFRREYDDEILSLMNKYKIYSEGELMTGCIRAYHRLNKRRQHSLSEDVRRQCQQLRELTRASFLREVYFECNVAGNDFFSQKMHDNIFNDDKAEAQALSGLEDLMLTDSIDPDREISDDIKRYLESLDYLRMSKYARKLAAACYFVTYNPQLRCDDYKDTTMQPSNNCAEEDNLCASILHSLRDSSEGEASHEACALFGFPWVFADIIAMGLRSTLL